MARPPDREVRRASFADAEAAAVVLANAFSDDPIMSHLIGERDDSEQRLGHLFGKVLSVELSKPQHLVDVVEGMSAVALWHDIDDWKTPVGVLVRSLPACGRTFGPRLPRALQLLTKVEKVHPEDPHRYLASYLGNSNPHNEALYARFGFESRGPISLPAGAPVLTAMWRDPR